jgi:hypothetical protein
MQEQDTSNRAPWLVAAVFAAVDFKYQQILTRWLALFCFGCLVLAGSHLAAQAVSGTILGTVTDAGGAAVTNAQVTIVLTGQQTTYNAVTNESGNFTEPDLPSGTYTLTVVAPGFKRETRENISVITNTTARVDVTLAAGSASETITVTAAPPLLQTDRADISTNIEQQKIANLPLTSGNSFQSLLNTVPGTSTSSTTGPRCSATMR